MALLPLLVLCALSSVCTPVQGEVKAIKLCGRGFIRAIVYTCGGSRWRRILNEPALPGHHCCWLMRAGVGSLTQDSFEFLSTSAPAPRHRRDLNEKLMIMCCQVGCRKSDLVFFC
ncbi:insulin-like 5a [Conger conger]|uniref:insulin-like 5a n=1 Tax=Conger conger TaxID=82655 RepID=UPI002A59A017|nr:insulin-like 5a [Conger conger]